MKQLLSILVFFTLFSFSTKGQTYFNTDFENDSSVWSIGTSVYQLKDSTGYIALGNIPKGGGPNYINFLRLDILGDTIFTKTIGKYNYNQELPNGRIISIGDTNFVFTAHQLIDSLPSNNDSSYIMFYKVDLNGNVLINKFFGESNEQNIPKDIQKTEDNGFAITGWTSGWGANNQYNGFLLKLDSLGNEEWHNVYGGLRAFYSIDCTIENGYILAGELTLGGNNIDLNVVKTDSLGNTIWSQTYGTSEPDNKLTYITNYLNSGDYILTGSIDELAGIGSDYQGYISRLDGINGNIVWDDTLGINKLNHGEGFFKSVIMNNGDITVLHHITPDTTSANWSGITRYTGFGNLVWTRSFNKYGGSTAQNYFYNIANTFDNGMIVCGNTTRTSPSFSQPIWFVKLDSMGCDIANCSVGMEESDFESDNILIYPNPTSGQLTIELNEQPKPNTNFKLFNITGKEIHNQQLHSALTTINVGSYPKGIYIYQLQSNKKIYAGKLVVN